MPVIRRAPIGARRRFLRKDEQAEAVAGVVEAGEEITLGFGLPGKSFPDALVPGVAVAKASIFPFAGRDFVGDLCLSQNHTLAASVVICETGACQKSAAQRTLTSSR